MAGNTADAARIHADGRFELLGRLDRIVKLEEKRISLPMLEQALMAHAWVAETRLGVRCPRLTRRAGGVERRWLACAAQSGATRRHPNLARAFEPALRSARKRWPRKRWRLLHQLR